MSRLAVAPVPALARRSSRGVLRRPRAEAGTTLIELMISLVISGILVTFIFSIKTNLANGLRTQNKLSDLQQTVQAARAMVSRDIRLAGFMIPDGFKTAIQGTPTAVLPSFQVLNNADGSGPDLLRVFYADAAVAAHVLTIDPTARAYAEVENAGAFVLGDVVVLTNPRFVAASVSGAADLVDYDACVVQITSIVPGTPTRIDFASNGAYNAALNPQCATVEASTTTEGAASETVMYRFHARSYRIDPTRKIESVLQMSPSGELATNDWVDLGFGFTDLQIASRFSESGDLADLDGDGDAAHDWYSAEAQETPDTTGSRPPGAVLVQVSLSIAVRTQTEVHGAGSSASPAFIDTARVSYNRLGDSPAVALAGVPDASRPVQYRGNHVYRFSSVAIDMRNMGVGR